MRVLHLIKTGEGATWAYRQIQILTAEGAEVAVCMPKGKFADKYTADGVQVFGMDFSLAPDKVLSSLRRFKKIVKEFKPDIIHSHFLVTTLFARLYRTFFGLNIPLVFQVPGPLHLEHFLFRNADLLSSNKNDRWIASCKWTKDKYLHGGIDEDRVFLSYYGTDLSFIQKQPKGKLRSVLSLADDDFIVAMVAYMYKPKKYIGQKHGIKGHEDFFKAMSQCIAQDPKMKAVVIGGAWDGAMDYELQLMEMGKRLCGENIYFMGTRNDVPELYADINLVVHPSYSENLGGAAESLLLEVPTIASNVGGLPDIVIPDRTGYLVRPGAPGEIAAAIMDVRNNYKRAKEMAMNGHLMLNTILDVNNTGKEVYGIYNTILNNKQLKYVPVF
ncbi:MAG: glycosyltransferase [Bacteroidetes bacterium]|nr:glycosyltransferase [Bacteroidota bacterium]